MNCQLAHSLILLPSSYDENHRGCRGEHDKCFWGEDPCRLHEVSVCNVCRPLKISQSFVQLYPPGKYSILCGAHGCHQPDEPCFLVVIDRLQYSPKLEERTGGTFRNILYRRIILSTIQSLCGTNEEHFLPSSYCGLCVKNLFIWQSLNNLPCSNNLHSSRWEVSYESLFRN